MEGAPSQAVAYKPASAFVASFSSYLLDVVHLPDHSKVATADSDRTIKLFDATTSQLDREIRAHTDTITQLHYSSAHPHVFFSSSADKSVRAWDTRSGDSAFTLSQRGQCQSVGIGVDGTALVAGSESDLMIWDLRKPTQAKMCFEDCHSDVVTRVQFHPQRPNLLCSGSEDGLVCILDLAQPTEDDALLNIIPIHHCILRVGFCGDDRIYVCTSTEQFSLWDVENTICLQNYGDVRERFSHEGRTVDYMIDCHYQPATDELLLFAGSHAGDMVIFQPTPQDLLHKASLDGGHTDVIRAVQYFPTQSVILSAGEDGKVCHWRASNENVIPPTEEGDDESMVDDLSDHNVRRALRNRYRYVLNPYYLRKNQRRDSSH